MIYHSKENSHNKNQKASKLIETQLLMNQYNTNFLTLSIKKAKTFTISNWTIFNKIKNDKMILSKRIQP